MRRGARYSGKVLERRTVEVDGLSVELAVKRIKNLSLRVRPDGTVALSVPAGMGERRALSFVREKRDWIEARRRELAAAPMHLERNPSPEDAAAWRALVEAAVPLLLAKWEPVMGVRAKTLAYRSMTSRWGSCQPATGRICINTQLAKYPLECLEYVVVHELAHLIEPGHGPRFQAILSRYLPDWKTRRAKLR